MATRRTRIAEAEKCMAEIAKMAHEALWTDGAHHKQWYLEEIMKAALGYLGEPMPDPDMWEPGIPD